MTRTPAMPTTASAELDDAVLLDRYRATDDREALGALLERHMDAAYRLARRYSDSAADAEDAVQAALLRVMRLAHQFRGETTVKAYILGSVVSECRNQVRAEQRRTKREGSAARVETTLDVNAHDPELQQAVLAAVQELPDHYRAPLWMHYYEGLSSTDVATSLNLSANTVRRQLARGVDRLRKSLSATGRVLSVPAVTAILASLPSETAPASLTSAVLGLVATAPAAVATTATAGVSHAGSILGKFSLTAKLSAAVVTAAAVTAGSVYVAQPRQAAAPVQVAEADSSSSKITGWRGDWHGRFENTEPPLTWERRAKTLMKDLRCQIKKPKSGDEATAAFVPWTGRVPEWLLLGPVSAKTLDDAVLPNEATVQPDEGQAAVGATWKPFTGNFKELGIGSSQAVYLHSYVSAPQAGKVNLWITSHVKGVRIWCNGKAVYTNNERRDANGRMKITLDLAKGWNRFLVKLLHNDAYTHLTTFFGPADPYGYDTKNFAWMTRLPGSSNAQPVVVGDKVFVTVEPYYLFCLDKKSGKVLWWRSHSWYDGNRADLVKKNDPKVKAFDDATKKLASLMDSLVKDINAGVSATGGGTKQVLTAAQLAEKYKAEQVLHTLGKEIDPDHHQKLGEAWEQSQPGWAVGTPCSDGKRLYAWFAHGVASCHELDGKPVWSKFVGFYGNRHHGFSASPVLAAGKFVVEGRGVMAFDIQTGDMVWKDKGRFLTWGSLVATKVGDEDIVFTADGTSMRLADGKNLWRSGLLDTHKTSTPIIEDGVLYDILSKHQLIAYQLPKTTKGDIKQLWKADLTFPARQGSSNHSADLVASPLYHNGLIYVISCGGYLKCFEAKSGKELYTKELPLKPYVGYTEAPGCTVSPTLAGGKYIYVFDNHGACVVFEAGREYKQVAYNVIENRASAGTWSEYQEQVWVTPTFDGKHMYLRSPEYLYCIGGN